MAIVDELRKVKDLDTTIFTGLGAQFKEIIYNRFLSIMNIDGNHYKFKASVGAGQLADMWWVSIFDIQYYFDFFKLTKQSEIGASRGFYVVYLFNKNKDCLFITLAQASSGVTSNKIDSKLMTEKNNIIQNALFKDTKYLKNIHGELTSEKIRMARDYENAVLIAKKYDLSKDIKDEEFVLDFKDFIDEYKRLIVYINSNPIILTSEFIVDFKTGYSTKRKVTIFDIEEYIENDKEQFKLQLETPYESVEELNAMDNRVPRIVNQVRESYYRDPKISKTVLKNSNYKCDISSQHITFSTPDDHLYTEAHHLIPMKYQNIFPDLNLDRSDNIISLCPICHNAIHYGNELEKIKRLKILFELKFIKSSLFNKVGTISYKELFEKFY